MLILTVAIPAFVFSPTMAVDFEGNKCFDEWDWCNDGTSDENAYWWDAGWCAAAIEASVLEGSVSDCTSSPDDSEDSVVSEVSDKSEKSEKSEVSEPEGSTEDSDDCEDSFIEISGELVCVEI
jgi:hypothetical protein